MKNLFLILLIVPTVSFSQVQTQSIQEDPQSKNAKKQSVVLESSTEIIIPKTVNFKNYSHLALVTINNLGSSTKGWYAIYEERLSGSPLVILNPFKVNKKKAAYDNNFLKTVENPKYLYLDYYRSKGGKNELPGTRITKIIVRDYKNNILYSVEHNNVTMKETLSPFINF
ncbi:hypothetical protein N9483_07780 [Flavobacteriaceae bacterium]|nr:hypothetical protein [Flavobacteriaceae bacterium]